MPARLCLGLSLSQIAATSLVVNLQIVVVRDTRSPHEPQNGTLCLAVISGLRSSLLVDLLRSWKKEKKNTMTK